MSDLDQARQAIDGADREIARLFERRMDAVRRVAEYKKAHSLPVEDIAREEHILRKNSALIENEEYRSYYESFLRSVMELSKKYQYDLLDASDCPYSVRQK